MLCKIKNKSIAKSNKFYDKEGLQEVLRGNCTGGRI